MISKKTTIFLLILLTLLIIIIISLLNPILQPLAYHNFADQRKFLGIPNAWNVLSNIPFVLAGLWGLFLLYIKKITFIDKRERWLWTAVSIGFILTFLGSSYYHLAPDNIRLLWDRIPIMFVFMSYVSALIAERISVSLGLRLWPALVLIGFLTILFWHMGDQRGVGDLRLYLALQEFTILATLVIMLAPSPYTRSYDLAPVVLFYLLAVFFELFDHQAYSLTGHVISGHALKHLSAGLAALWIVRMLAKRKIISKM